jgi:16S rRNA (cytidine1402-2'-O)-methyltransferase
MKGKLILIPTPIDETSPLEPVALELLKSMDDSKDIIAVEEVRECRRRWLRWGLERDWIEKFVVYNEHTRDSEKLNLIKELKKGKNVYLMSDCGLPAFCDPGVELVDLAHDNKIEVTATPFSNSISLAVALCGFDHSRFVFEGFVSNKSGNRASELKRILGSKTMSILMDTPYRLKKIIPELKAYSKDPNKRIFIGLNLNQPNQKLVRTTIGNLDASTLSIKAEFIIILDN